MAYITSPSCAPQLEKEEDLKEGKRFVNAVRDPGFCFKWPRILTVILALEAKQRARKGTRGSDIYLCCKIIFSLLWWNKASSLCLDHCSLEKAMWLLKLCVFNFFFLVLLCNGSGWCLWKGYYVFVQWLILFSWVEYLYRYVLVINLQFLKLSLYLLIVTVPEMIFEIYPYFLNFLFFLFLFLLVYLF